MCALQLACLLCSLQIYLRLHFLILKHGINEHRSSVCLCICKVCRPHAQCHHEVFHMINISNDLCCHFRLPGGTHGVFFSFLLPLPKVNISHLMSALPKDCFFCRRNGSKMASTMRSCICCSPSQFSKLPISQDRAPLQHHISLWTCYPSSVLWHQKAQIQLC